MQIAMEHMTDDIRSYFLGFFMVNICVNGARLDGIVSNQDEEVQHEQMCPTWRLKERGH